MGQDDTDVAVQLGQPIPQALQRLRGNDYHLQVSWVRTVPEAGRPVNSDIHPASSLAQQGSDGVQCRHGRRKYVGGARLDKYSSPG